MIRVFDFIRGWLQANPQDRALARFNRSRGCAVLSPVTDLRCIAGTGVYVGVNAFVYNGSVVHDHAWIGPGSIVDAATVGAYTALGPGVFVGLADHDVGRVAIPAFLYPDGVAQLYRRPCTIGPAAWLGAGSIIRRGVTVGEGGVVGANSFVNSDVPPYAIVAGSPARLIRYRFDAGTIDRITASRWWSYELAEAQRVVRDLEDQLGERLTPPVDSPPTTPTGPGHGRHLGYEWRCGETEER